MSEPGNFDDMREDAARMDTPVDPYTTESSADIYATPEVSRDTTDVVANDTLGDMVVTDTHGLFSGSGQPVDTSYGAGNAYNSNPTYGGSSYGAENAYDTNNPYNVGSGYHPSNAYGMGNGYYPGNPYDAGSGYHPGNAYGTGGYHAGNAYDAGNGNPPGNAYGTGGYHAGNAYDAGNGNLPGNVNDVGNGNPPGNVYGIGNGYNPYDAGSGYHPGNPYNPANGANPYGGQQTNGGYGGQPPYGTPPFNDNPYSPYAAPQKKGHTGLIITMVIIVIALFILAVCALAYRAVEMIDESDIDEIINGGKYDFDDDYDYDHDDDFYGYDDDDDFFYGGDYDYDYDYENDIYYSLQDDLKYDLSYQIDFDFFEYETDNEDVSILVTYPIVVGEDVQNLDMINDALSAEAELITEYFEEDYAPYMKNNENSYFSASAVAYVTYMDEDKLSVAFQERIYADTYDLAYLECINIDMANGVILDNEEMLSIDDDFSVEFRTRSDEQNGEIYSLTNMTDQQITGYFNSPDVIVFYTPKGMEIGFNYEDGWVTVTYEEYEQYLNVF